MSPVMGVRVGDLVVRDGVTVHEPSGRAFRHYVGVSLVVGTVLGFEVVLDETEASAARRMRAWLRRVGSRVQVVAHSRHGYRLRAAPSE
jgi:hypothetical protein